MILFSIAWHFLVFRALTQNLFQPNDMGLAIPVIIQPKPVDLEAPPSGENDQNNVMKLSFQSFDPSKSPNTDLVKTVDFQNPAFLKFLNANPGVSTPFNQLLSSHSLPSVETLDGSQLFNFPDPELIEKEIENILTLYVSTRDYVRTILHKIEEYMLRNDILITELVRKLESSKADLEQMLSDIKSTTNQNMRSLNELNRKNFISTGNVTLNNIKHFNNCKRWREKMVSILNVSY